MGVASDNVFYVVNPDGNLPETQTRLDKAFQDYRQWEGVAGVEPRWETEGWPPPWPPEEMVRRISSTSCSPVVSARIVVFPNTQLFKAFCAWREGLEEHNDKPLITT